MEQVQAEQSFLYCIVFLDNQLILCQTLITRMNIFVSVPSHISSSSFVLTLYITAASVLLTG